MNLLPTAADYEKFVESFEDNYLGVCDGRSVWMIDCRKLDGSDQDENLEILVGRNSRIHELIFLGSKDQHEQHSHLYVGISRFLSAQNVLTIICESGRRSSVANAELWSSTLSRYGRYSHSVSLIHLSEHDFCGTTHALENAQSVSNSLPNFSNTQRRCLCRMFAARCRDRLGDRCTERPIRKAARDCSCKS